MAGPNLESDPILSEVAYKCQENDAYNGIGPKVATNVAIVRVHGLSWGGALPLWYYRRCGSPAIPPLFLNINAPSAVVMVTTNLNTQHNTRSQDDRMTTTLLLTIETAKR